jgi:hypothetical protein
MKKIFLLIVVVIAGWWYFVGGRTLTEQHARDFYNDSDVAMLKRDPAALCALLADDFNAKGTVMVGGQHRLDDHNKSQACQSYQEFFVSLEQIGEKLGGILQIDTDYEIHSIEIAADKKSATVDISHKLDFGGSVMNMRSRSTDVLIRRNGKMLVRSSESKATIRGRFF